MPNVLKSRSLNRLEPSGPSRPVMGLLYLYLDSLAAAVKEPTVYRLLTFHIPNLMFLFGCVGCVDVHPLVSVMSDVSCRVVGWMSRFYYFLTL